MSGTTYRLSGSDRSIIFYSRIFKAFLYYAGSGQPLLLLMDGHSSHYNLEAVTMAKENGVMILYFLHLFYTLLMKCSH